MLGHAALIVEPETLNCHSEPSPPLGGRSGSGNLNSDNRGKPKPLRALLKGIWQEIEAYVKCLLFKYGCFWTRPSTP